MIELHWTPQPNNTDPLAGFALTGVDQDNCRVLKITPDGNGKFVLECDDGGETSGYKALGSYDSIFTAQGAARDYLMERGL